jgi:hypothetical protein
MDISSWWRGIKVCEGWGEIANTQVTQKIDDLRFASYLLIGIRLLAQSSTWD